VNFYGDEIQSIVDENQKVYIPLKRISENIGLDWKNEYRRINSDVCLNLSIVNFTIDVKDTTGRVRAVEMICLPMDMINGYLFGVPITKRTKPNIREKLILYKNECYKVLNSHFNSNDLIEGLTLEKIELYLTNKIRKVDTEIKNTNHRVDIIENKVEILKDKVEILEINGHCIDNLQRDNLLKQINSIAYFRMQSERITRATSKKKILEELYSFMKISNLCDILFTEYNCAMSYLSEQLSKWSDYRGWINKRDNRILNELLPF
jgi:hypothetical protein